MRHHWRHQRRNRFRGFADQQATHRRLTELPPGAHARILGFDTRLSAERRTILQAYGVLPGGEMWVRQHNPVTVIQVEHTELALEADLAAAIQVEEI